MVQFDANKPVKSALALVDSETVTFAFGTKAAEETAVRDNAYRGKRVTVMGLGLFGGGVGAARFFAESGAMVTVTDLRSEVDLRPSMKALEDLPIRYVLERHEPRDFRKTDILVVNPSVPQDSPLVTMARGAGVKIEREINLLFKLTSNQPKLGITGSNGKSTTTSLLGAMLSLHDKRTQVGGNIGKSLLNELASMHPGVPLVLELSSFMLEGLRELEESPGIAIVTNLSPNHLDRHRTLENYYGAKRAIIDYQQPGDFAVLNADDPELLKWEGYLKGHAIWFSVERNPQTPNSAYVDGNSLIVSMNGEINVVGTREMVKLPGKHNLANVLAASAAAIAHGVQAWEIAEALASFEGLPHRLEMVAKTSDEIRFYNDSIATTPESAICALNSFDGQITMIAGGYDKGTPFDELGERIAQKVSRLILLGSTSAKIESCVLRAAQRMQKNIEIHHARDLQEAAYLARSRANPKEIILLSPACASYDMFRNFQERGDLFRHLARELA